MILRQYNQVGNNFFFHHSYSPVSSDGQTIGPEVHRQYELFYLLRGSLTYHIEGQTYAVHPGDMILIAPNDIHMLQISPEQEYERIVLHFNLELLKGAFRELVPEFSGMLWRNPFPVIPSILCQRFRLQETLQSLVKSQEPEHYQGLQALLKIIEVLICLDRLLSQDGLRAVQPVAVDPLVQKVTAFIDANLSQQITLDAMAHKMFVSKSSLCHRFRNAMNMTVNRYITVKRIYIADELIRGGMSVAEAAQSVGYSNYTTFYHNFKAILGKAPSAGK